MSLISYQITPYRNRELTLANFAAFLDAYPMVLSKKGFEPLHINALQPKCSVSTNSTTLILTYYWT